MVSILIIIAVAVAAAVTLTVTGVVLAVIVERRRHRNFVRRCGLEHQKHRSSNSQRISSSNYHDSVFSSKYARPSVPLPRSITARTWITIPSDEYTQQEMAIIPEEGLLESMAQVQRSKRGLQICGSPISKTRRQKKIAKITLKNPARLQFSSTIEPSISVAQQPLKGDSPKSTAMLQRSSMESPRSSLHMIDNSSTGHGALYGRDTKFTEVDKLAMVPRKMSLSQSLSSAPNSPLPPLPVIDAQGRKQTILKPRTSTTSMDTVSTTLLGTRLSCPAPAVIATSKTQSQAFKEFDFGLNSSRSSHWAPNQHTPRGVRLGRGLSAFPKPARTNSNISLASTNRLDRSPLLQTIDASNWNVQLRRNTSKRASNTYRRSMVGLEFSSSRTSMSNPDNFPSKEAQMASPAPTERITPPLNTELIKSPSISSMDMLRNSTGSPSSLRKGHKRQNCVRIKNLTPVDSTKRSSRQSCLWELKEEETLIDAEEQGLEMADLEEGQKIRSARPSMIEITSSPASLKLERPTIQRDDTNNSDKSRPDSEFFATTASKPSPLRKGLSALTRESFQSPKKNKPLELASSGNIKMNSTPSPSSISKKSKFLDPNNSPILPSPAHRASKLFARTSLVKGPRSQPFPRRSNRNDSESPLKSRPPSLIRQRTNEADLRRSIAILRSMSSDAELLASATNKDYEDALDSIAASPSSPNSISCMRLAPPIRRRKRSSTMSAYSERSSVSKRHHGRMNSSPNHIRMLMVPNSAGRSTRNSLVSSYSDTSIWEDASIRDSPEPDLSTPTKIFPKQASKIMESIGETHEMQRDVEFDVFQSKAQSLGPVPPPVLKPTVNVVKEQQTFENVVRNEIQHQHQQRQRQKRSPIKSKHSKSYSSSSTKENVGLGLSINSQPWGVEI